MTAGSSAGWLWVLSAHPGKGAGRWRQIACGVAESEGEAWAAVREAVDARLRGEGRAPLSGSVNPARERHPKLGVWRRLAGGVRFDGRVERAGVAR